MLVPSISNRNSAGGASAGMAKSNAKGRSKGAFVMVPNSLMNSPAWQHLSGTAVKLLLHLMKLSEGNNGWGHGKAEPGELYLGERDAAQAIGTARNTASKAFVELIEHGFLRVVRGGDFRVKIRLATVWRLTFQPYPRAHQGPTNEWRQWQPEQNSRAQKLNATGAKIGHSSENAGFTGARTDPVKTTNGGNQPIPLGSNIGPHLHLTMGGEDARTGDDGDPEPRMPPQIADDPAERLNGADAVQAIRIKVIRHWGKLNTAARRRAWATANGVTVEVLRAYVLSDPDALPFTKQAALASAISLEKRAETQRRNQRRAQA